jgi:hypothetical protein
MRSVMEMADMLPSLSNATVTGRDGLALIVRAFGQTNDRFAAYHLAEVLNRDARARVADL